jgi:hypothetical protein
MSEYDESGNHTAWQEWIPHAAAAVVGVALFVLTRGLRRYLGEVLTG